MLFSQKHCLGIVLPSGRTSISDLSLPCGLTWAMGFSLLFGRLLYVRLPIVLSSTPFLLLQLFFSILWRFLLSHLLAHAKTSNPQNKLSIISKRNITNKNFVCSRYSLNSEVSHFSVIIFLNRKAGKDMLSVIEPSVLILMVLGTIFAFLNSFVLEILPLTLGYALISTHSDF